MFTEKEWWKKRRWNFMCVAVEFYDLNKSSRSVCWSGSSKMKKVIARKQKLRILDDCFFFLLILLNSVNVLDVALSLRVGGNCSMPTHQKNYNPFGQANFQPQILYRLPVKRFPVYVFVVFIWDLIEKEASVLFREIYLSNLIRMNIYKFHPFLFHFNRIGQVIRM